MRKCVVSAVLSGCVSATVFGANPCETESKVWPYELQEANDNGNVSIYADLQFERACDYLQAETKFSARGEVYGLGGDLVDLTATAKIAELRNASITGDLSILGYVVADIEHGEDFSLGHSKSLAAPIELSSSQIFLVGPVPVNVKLGVVGQAGLDYGGDLSPGAVSMKADPFVKTQFFASVGLDAMVAEINTKGTLTLLKDSLANKISLAVNQEDFETAALDASGNNVLDALEGNVTLNAVASAMGKEKTYSKELLSWDGVARDDALYAVDLQVPTGM